MQVCNSLWIIAKIKTREMSVWAKFAKISSRENFYLYSNNCVFTFLRQLWQSNAHKLKFWCVKCTNPKDECIGQASKLKQKCITGPDPGFAKRGSRVSKLRENWLIWPQNRLNLHDLVVKRGGRGQIGPYLDPPLHYSVTIFEHKVNKQLLI